MMNLSHKNGLVKKALRKYLMKRLKTVDHIPLLNKINLLKSLALVDRGKKIGLLQFQLCKYF